MPADPLFPFPLDPSLRPALALGILGLTYLIIALQKVPFTRLDRPSGALLGAVLTVTLGVLTPQQVYREAIHFDTIALLLGMMILAAYLAEAAFFRKASQLALRAARTPRGLLAGVTLVCAGLSAFLVNDTVCVMVTPLVLQLVDDAKLPPLPYLLGVAMGSNVGSAATFTGNPQNMLVGQLSGISYGHFAAVMAPIALVTSLMCAGLLVLLFRKQLPRRRFELQPPPPPVDRPLLAKSMIAFFGVVIAFFAGLPTAWSALAAAALLMAAGNRGCSSGSTSCCCSSSRASLSSSTASMRPAGPSGCSPRLGPTWAARQAVRWSLSPRSPSSPPTSSRTSPSSCLRASGSPPLPSPR
jgi:Na+/H+ antiporter NhaD/arsenite permease-like protein